MSTVSVRVGLDALRTLINSDIGEDLDFKDMIYVDGAGRDTSKLCLPGTREDILSEIKNWIDSPGEDAQRVFWLNGTAGKGTRSHQSQFLKRWYEYPIHMRFCHHKRSLRIFHQPKRLYSKPC